MSFIICIILLVLVLVFCMKGSKQSLAGGGNGTIMKGGTNNPGYLVVSNASWLGASHAGNQKFENFTTLQLGARAWFINLLNKVKSGKIRSTDEMIDVLTPAGSENPEQARINYKESVRNANSWAELGYLVFEFEANPDWVRLTDNEKSHIISLALPSAVNYCGSVPYFNK